MSKNLLDLQDFLDACGDAAKRTRFLMIVLIVVFVLALTGYMNSIDSSWMVSRIHAVSHLTNPYTAAKFDYQPESLDTRYLNFHAALTRSYVENALTMRVPFFGVAFDINDLGLLSGISFITVLGLLRFSIRNEIVSLSLSFKEARKFNIALPGELEKFYDLLAMKLVLTMPQLEDNDLGKKWLMFSKLKVLRLIPKLICFLPFVVYSLVAYNDYLTLATGEILNPKRTTYLYFYTYFFWFAIPSLGLWCFFKLRAIDKILDAQWDIIRGRNPHSESHPESYNEGELTRDKDNNE